jgi:hypothetical protein
MQNADLHQRIKLRAYLIWEQEGRPEGRAEEHWRRAETEVAGSSSARARPARASTSVRPVKEPDGSAVNAARHAAALAAP